MKVVCVINTCDDDGQDNGSLVRLHAYKDISKACELVKAQMERIPFEKLDFGETAVLDTFYNADVAVVDVSVSIQRSPLFYHIGVRQSMSMKANLVLFHDRDPEVNLSLRLSCSPHTLIPYQLDSEGNCIVVDSVVKTGDPSTHDTGPQLVKKLKRCLKEVDQDNSVHMAERFLNEIRKAKNQKPEELAKTLKGLRRRLDDPQLLSVDVILNMLLSYRQIQDYNAIVTLVEQLSRIPNNNVVDTIAIQTLYSFALNRRNQNADRQKALSVVQKCIARCESPVPDIVCLCGRVYKDMYIEGDYKDQSLLDNAIQWYRQGFEVQPNEYAGINLATLLVISGKSFAKCGELQHIGLVLNNLIGKKGNLSSLKEYWDVATFFEISVLAEDYAKACQSAECMFNLQPPIWYLTSTIGNIRLINRFRFDDTETAEKHKQVFLFWMDFFVEAIEPQCSAVRYPVLVQEANKVMMPSSIKNCLK